MCQGAGTLVVYSNILLCIFSGFFRIVYIKDYLIYNRDSFTFSFPIWMPCVTFSCLIALSTTSNTILNRSSESRYSSLDLTIKHDTRYEVLEMPFIKFRKFLSIFGLLCAFTREC